MRETLREGERVRGRTLQRQKRNQREKFEGGCPETYVGQARAEA